MEEQDFRTYGRQKDSSGILKEEQGQYLKNAWEQFASTGRVEDYLKYRQVEASDGGGSEVTS